MTQALNFVGGKWYWPKGAGEITSVNPADERDTIARQIKVHGL